MQAAMDTAHNLCPPVMQKSGVRDQLINAMSERIHLQEHLNLSSVLDQMVTDVFSKLKWVTCLAPFSSSSVGLSGGSGEPQQCDASHSCPVWGWEVPWGAVPASTSHCWERGAWRQGGCRHLTLSCLAACLLWEATAGTCGIPDAPLSAPSEIKLSVTAAVADCIVDAVLGDLSAAQCKLVSAGVPNPMERTCQGGGLSRHHSAW